MSFLSLEEKYPLSFQVELRGLPQPLLNLQVELLLPCPVKATQGIGIEAQEFALPLENSEILGYVSTQNTECLAWILFLRHKITQNGSFSFQF